ncbi:hypothetical protein [Pseudomonas gingeri]|uniref:hypothetical protein n=1 Tax=Pseudomonas gingeri TaxID=117681 RepID=UPI0015A14239|nr:hypothetical protein [Pseudomonas gingeri]NWE46864.1 hypothetical protein [Pseudomonas gingeri]
MAEFKIPDPEAGSKIPSELTKLEVAELAATKRSSFLYERSIEDLKDHISSLKEAVATRDSKLSGRCQDVESIRNELATLRRANAEMFVCFLISTLTMAIGGALISSYPFSESVTPWQFSLGWGLVILSIVFGLFNRFVVWVYCYFTIDSRPRKPSSEPSMSVS